MPGPYRLERALIRVSGPDAVSFLNNLLTQDVSRLAEAGVLYGALLTPQGKVIADMLLWADGENVLIECDPARAEDLSRRLSIYKLRADVTIETATNQFHALFDTAPFPDAAADPRRSDGALGWRAVRSAQAGAVADGAGALDAHRIALGVPDLARDAQPEEVFALEALLEELNGVAFDKGCFVGQENVSRMKRRGTTRKKFCPVVFEGAAPAYGTPVLAGAAEIGTIRTGTQARAIALIRLDRAVEALEKGHTLEADGREVRLDPPDWLGLPPREGAGAPD